jgi:hypothetical protein
VEPNEEKTRDALADSERPPVPVPKRDGLTPKDWITLTLSILAFGISAGSAYYNIVRQSDHVRILIHTTPFITLDQDRTRFAAEPNETVLFINSGNRTAAITAVDLRVDQDRAKPEECGATAGIQLEYDIEPLVLKPGEIVAKTMKLKGKRPPEYIGVDPLAVNANGFVTFPVSNENMARDTLWIRVCMEIWVVTPDEYRSFTQIELYRSEIDINGQYILPTFKSSGWINEPRSLVQRSGSIFFQN